MFMHYYVFKVTEPTTIIKNCEFLDKFEVLKEAKAYTRNLRAELPLNGIVDIKMIQASNQLDAEELLQEKHKKTIVVGSNGMEEMEKTNKK